MKKSFIVFILIFFITIGYATVTAILDINSSIAVSENIEDFKIEITNLKINNNDSKSLISKGKHSFTFTGTGNDSINYTVTNYSYQYDANITLTCNPSDGITIEQINTLPAQDRLTKSIISKRSDEITCTINIEKISRTEYAEDMCKFVEGTEWTFDYTGSEQTFTVPCDGEYKLETWGAQGGSYDATYYGGYGAYSTGVVKLTENAKIFINIGGQGKKIRNPGDFTTKISGGYNGGGIGIRPWTDSRNTTQYNISGGGATHISFVGDLLSTLENKKEQLLIVSSGGGGAQIFETGSWYVYCIGGHGGGNIGSRSVCIENFPYNISSYSNASQIKPGYAKYNEDTPSSGAFGLGGAGYSGGGGGLYGGAGTYKATGGGSSYIGNPSLTNKVMYCYNCEESNEESTKTISTTCTSSTPTANCAKQGNGYAKITYLGK